MVNDHLEPFTIQKYEDMGRYMLEGIFETVRIGLKFPPFSDFSFSTVLPELPFSHLLMRGENEYKKTIRDIQDYLTTKDR